MSLQVWLKLGACKGERREGIYQSFSPGHPEIHRYILIDYLILKSQFYELIFYTSMYCYL